MKLVRTHVICDVHKTKLSPNAKVQIVLLLFKQNRFYKMMHSIFKQLSLLWDERQKDQNI